MLEIVLNMLVTSTIALGFISIWSATKNPKYPFYDMKQEKQVNIFFKNSNRQWLVNHLISWPFTNFKTLC